MSSAIVAALCTSVVIYRLTDVMKFGGAQPGVQKDLRNIEDRICQDTGSVLGAAEEKTQFK